MKPSSQSASGMPSPLISLRSIAATRDMHIPHLGANHQVVRKSFSSWNHYSFVLHAPEILTLSGKNGRPLPVPQKNGWHAEAASTTKWA
jgi:hypothetical protein